jgi:4-hydroxymandelate synthase
MSEWRGGSSVTAQDIEYVELYTGNIAAVIDYFVSSLGFTLMAESAQDGSRSSLLRHGTVQLVVTAGSATEEFVEAHGDGIADIAFGCDDPALACERAIAAGATRIDAPPGKLVVSGFGDTRHTLVARSAGPGLPADRAWRPVSAAPARPGRIWLLDHVAILVEGGTLTQSVDFYSDAFGLSRYSDEYIEIGEQAIDSIVVRSPSGGITFTILEQDRDRKPGQVEGFISRYGGSGVQHLAFLVDDIVSAVHEFRHQGVGFLHSPDAYYEMLAQRLPAIKEEIADLRATSVLADRDEWGYLLQLFTRSPYTRNTLFYELVQRRGARGFGTSNIRALYEAVERDDSGAAR